MLLATSENQMVFLKEMVPSKTLGDWSHEQNSFDGTHKNLPLYDPLLPNPFDSTLPKILQLPEVDVDAPYHPPEIIHPIQLDIKLLSPPMYRMELPPKPFLPLPPDMPPPHHFLLPFSVPAATKSQAKTSYGTYNMVPIDLIEKTKETTPMSISLDDTRHPNDSRSLKPLGPSKTWNSFSAFNFPLQEANTNHRLYSMVSKEQTEKTPEMSPLSVLFSENTYHPKDSLLYGLYYPKTRNSFPVFNPSLQGAALNTSHSVHDSVSTDQTERTPEPTPISLFFSEGVHGTDSLFFRPIEPPKARRHFSVFNTPVRDTETDVVNTWKHSNMFSFFPDSWFLQSSNIKQNLNLVTVPSILERTEREKFKMYTRNLITKEKGMMRIIPLRKGTVGKKIGTLKQVKGQGRFSSLVKTLPKRYDENATFRRVLDFRQLLK